MANKLLTGAQLMELIRYQIEDVCIELMEWNGTDYSDEIAALRELKKSVKGWVWDWTTPSFDWTHEVVSGYHYIVVKHGDKEFVSPLWVPPVITR